MPPSNDFSRLIDELVSQSTSRAAPVAAPAARRQPPRGGGALIGLRTTPDRVMAKALSDGLREAKENIAEFARTHPDRTREEIVADLRQQGRALAVQTRARLEKALDSGTMTPAEVRRGESLLNAWCARMAL